MQALTKNGVLKTIKQFIGNILRGSDGLCTTEAERLSAETGRLPAAGEVALRLRPNARRLMARIGARIPATARNAAVLAEIDRVCKVCPDDARCRRWLDSGDTKAYRAFCPNVARWDEIQA